MVDLKRHSGFTLVELLVVVAIIVLITSVSVPMMARSGMFSGNKTNAAAVDLYAQLRGAQTYATTQNVDTAIVYGIALNNGNYISDSVYNLATNGPIAAVDTATFDDHVELADPLYSATYNPETAVLNSTMLVRRITLEELREVDNDVDNVPLAQYIINEFNATQREYNLISMTYEETQDVFVPVENSFGQFQSLPNDACLLTNHWSMLEHGVDGEQLQENGGFTGVDVIRVEREIDPGTGRDTFVITRMLPAINDTDISDASTPLELYRGFPEDLDIVWKNQFPAHVFKSSGGLLATTTKQRLQLSVGMSPDADYTERFLIDDATGDIEMDANDDLIALDTGIEIYVATGRVKVADDAL